jgi:hypothetical protein
MELLESFTEENVRKARLLFGTATAWDYEHLMGDTLKEKSESLFIRVYEMANVVSAKTGGTQPDWVLFNDSFRDMFEVFCQEKVSFDKPTSYLCKLSGRWDAFRTKFLNSGEVLLGTNDALRNPVGNSKYIARILIHNMPN